MRTRDVELDPTVPNVEEIDSILAMMTPTMRQVEPELMDQLLELRSRLTQKTCS